MSDRDKLVEAIQEASQSGFIQCGQKQCGKCVDAVLVRMSLTKVMDKNISDVPKRAGKLEGLFRQSGFHATMDFLFYRTLCPMPGQTKLSMWWYGVSGRISGYFHSMHCSRCIPRDDNLRSMWTTRLGWWAEYGHWCHVSFFRAIGHLLRGGKIKVGRL